jgi:hypothetical protein
MRASRSKSKADLDGADADSFAEAFNSQYAVRANDCRPQLPIEGEPPKNQLRKNQILPQAKLRITLSPGPLGSVQSLARQFHIPSVSARHIVKAISEICCRVAHSCVRTAQSWLGKPAGIADSSTLVCAIDRVKWDETRQKVIRLSMLNGQPHAASLQDGQRALPLDDKLRQPVALRRKAISKSKAKGANQHPRGQKTLRRWVVRRPKYDKSRRIYGGSESILLQRRWLRVSKQTHDADHPAGVAWKDLLLPIACPPTMLAANDASCIERGFQKCEPCSLMELASCHARRKVVIRECDAANSNVSYVNTLRETKPWNVLIFLIFRMVHQLHLVTGFVLASMGLGKLELVALLLRTPGMFQILLCHVERMVSDFFVVIHVPLDPRAHAVSKIIRILGGWDMTDPDVGEFFGVFNHWWHFEWGLIHSCHCTTRCVASKMVPSVARCIIRIMFWSRPDIPIPARWTRVWSSTAWFTPPFCCHGIFKKLFRMGFDPSYASEMLAILQTPARGCVRSKYALQVPGLSRNCMLIFV